MRGRHGAPGMWLAAVVVGLALVAASGVARGADDETPDTTTTTTTQPAVCNQIGGICGGCQGPGVCARHVGSSRAPLVCMQLTRCLPRDCQNDRACPQGQYCVEFGGSRNCCPPCR